jgi:phosphatidyl-myo-inositol dimannoside synthase
MTVEHLKWSSTRRPNVCPLAEFILLRRRPDPDAWGRIGAVSAAPSRIVLVSEVFPPTVGGSGMLLESTYRRLQDVTVSVLTDGPPGSTVGSRGHLAVHHVPMRAPDWGLLRPSCLRRHVRVARAIRKLSTRADVVHCGRGLPEGLSARLAQLPGGAKYVCWAHGEELGFASTSRELTSLMRRVLADASALIANSANSKRLLIDRWSVPDAKVHVVYPGVDTDRFNPGVNGGGLRMQVAGDADVVFLSVGRLQRRKGHDMVIAALPEVRRAVPRVRYIVVGDGPDRPVLEQQARDAGVADITRFVGAVDDDDLPRWYRAADVFVLPNRTDGVDFEGFGIVFLEAAAAGLPVVGGRSGGVPETMIDHVTGRLVSGTDVTELASVLIGLASSRDVRVGLGRSGRARAISDFSWARAAAQVAALDEAIRRERDPAARAA